MDLAFHSSLLLLFWFMMQYEANITVMVQICHRPIETQNQYDAFVLVLELFWDTLCSINPESETMKTRRNNAPIIPNFSPSLDIYMIHMNFSVVPEESTLQK